MIEIRQIAFHYPQSGFVLNVPRLSLQQGAKAAIIGPSGSGKTTLLNLICGVSLPDRGSVRILGTEINCLAEPVRRDFRIRHVGMVFQEFELLDYLDVFDNILLPYRIGNGLSLTAEVRDRAADLARRVGLGGSLHRNVGRLSQGERQRVGVCRALLTQPPVLLADEPTGNLDPANKAQVLEILISAAADRGSTFLMVTHDHSLLDRFDEVVDCRRFHQAVAEP